MHIYIYIYLYLYDPPSVFFHIASWSTGKSGCVVLAARPGTVRRYSPLDARVHQLRAIKEDSGLVCLCVYMYICLYVYITEVEDSSF